MLMPSIIGESLLNDFMDDFGGATRNNARYHASTAGVMRTDILESENDYEIHMELPGYRKEDVQAELKDGYLIITARNEGSKEENNNKKYIRRERFYGTCSRSFHVGEDIRQEDIKARFENGVLIMVIPKHVEKPVEEKKYISIAG